VFSRVSRALVPQVPEGRISDSPSLSTRKDYPFPSNLARQWRRLSSLPRSVVLFNDGLSSPLLIPFFFSSIHDPGMERLRGQALFIQDQSCSLSNLNGIILPLGHKDSISGFFCPDGGLRSPPSCQRLNVTSRRQT